LSLDGEIDARLPAEAETALFRIAQEALANVAKHAAAHHVSLRLARHNGTALLEVEDDGVGLTASAGGNGHVAQNGGMGLFSMRERAALLGGRCLVTAGPRGAGTLVHAEVPVHA
jgi:signal transduction histidine kinase